MTKSNIDTFGYTLKLLIFTVTVILPGNFENTWTEGQSDNQYLIPPSEQCFDLKFYQNNTYIFSSKQLPDEKFRPYIGNGYIATAVHSSMIFMNGLYNGKGGSSHRAEIPSISFFNTSKSSHPTYSLDTYQGLYIEVSKEENLCVIRRVYAHRKYDNLLVSELEITRSNSSKKLSINLDVVKWHQSSDIAFNFTTLDFINATYMRGTILIPERPEGNPISEVHVIYDTVPNKIEFCDGCSRIHKVFLTVIGCSKSEVFAAHKNALNLFKKNNALLQEHILEWKNIWTNGNIKAIGNFRLSSAIHGSFYYILSSIKFSENEYNPFVGLSPSGLAFGHPKQNHNHDYQGHVFWDQDMWVFPSMLMFYPEIGRMILNSRKRMCDFAQKKSLHYGFRGLMFPWESAATGYDVCPVDINSKEEIHVTGSVSWIISKYLQVTGDMNILKEDNYSSIINGIADFWVSRSTYDNLRKKYTINEVIPPDEYHNHVNNSVYTNIIAQISINNSIKYGNLSQDKVKYYENVSRDMYIPFDNLSMYHPEFENYKKGDWVKQADVILLSYPLGVNVSSLVARNDLNTYVSVTDKNGPAMTWSMFCIASLDVDNELKANEYFLKNYEYIMNDYQVWNEEVRGNGASNFLTGMGGFLQSLIYGYGGIRIQETHLSFNPRMPDMVKELQFTSLNYLGSSFHYSFNSSLISISLIHRNDNSPTLYLCLTNPYSIFKLKINETQSCKLQKFYISSSTNLFAKL